MHKNQIIPLEITALSGDGNGVGRFEGQVVFVPDSAPGDELSVKIVKANKRFAYGRIESIEKPGAHRIDPDCPISGRCGGCQFRHLDYAEELVAKQGFVADALQRIGGFDIESLPTLPSPQPNRYRNKVQYPVTPGPSGEMVYGFYAQRSHRVIPCKDCLLQPVLLNQIVGHTAQLLSGFGAAPYDEATCAGAVRHIVVRHGTATGQVLVCIVSAQPSLPHGDDLCRALVAAFPQVETVVLNHNPANTNVILGKSSQVLYGPGSIKEVLCGVPLLLNAHTFGQVNTPAAEQLFKVAASYAAPEPEDILLDLYYGTGVIALSMAGKVRQLIGVEIVPDAIENAQASAKQMGLANTRFMCADAGKAAIQLAAEGLRPDIVILDPPRKGADEATLQSILAMAPSKIVMVSCNPATAARDLAVLCDNGYSLQQVQPADLFPRIRHVEMVVLLTKN